MNHFRELKIRSRTAMATEKDVKKSNRFYKQIDCDQSLFFLVRRAKHTRHAINHVRSRARSSLV